MHLYFVTVSHKCKLEPELNFVLVTETEAVNTTLTHVSKQLLIIYKSSNYGATIVHVISV